MLICVQKSDFRNVSEGEVIALFKDNYFIGYANVFTILENITILDVSKKIAQLYEDLIKDNKIVSFRIY